MTASDTLLVLANLSFATAGVAFFFEGYILRSVTQLQNRYVTKKGLTTPAAAERAEERRKRQVVGFFAFFWGLAFILSAIAVFVGD